jgi:phosphoglycerate dehydrogenase-like enzyme
LAEKDQLNVLIVTKLDEESIKKISNISPRINLKFSYPAWSAEDVYPPCDTENDSEALDELLSDTEVIFGFWPPKNVVKRAPKLRWIQTTLAGVNKFLNADLVRSDIIITNTRGMHVPQISELVFEKILMYAKLAPMYFRYQEEKKWERHILGLLTGKTIGIIGFGAIGRGIAKIAKAFNMRVVATKRTAKIISRARNVDVLYPKSELNQLLAESDFVVMVLPATPETENMIGTKELRLMKPGAFLVNVGRGSTLVEEALVKALQEKWIGGAGLDTFAIEPLPKNSKLWDMPNVIMTPHVAGPIEDYLQRSADIFCENLKRYVKGQKLRNIVDKKHGY